MLPFINKQTWTTSKGNTVTEYTFGGLDNCDTPFCSKVYHHRTNNEPLFMWVRIRVYMTPAHAPLYSLSWSYKNAWTYFEDAFDREMAWYLRENFPAEFAHIKADMGLRMYKGA